MNRFHPLTRVAYRFALTRINEARIRFLLARVWWRARRKHRYDDIARADDSDDEKSPTLSEILQRDRRLRLSFIADLVTITAAEKENRMWLIRELAKPEDYIVFLANAGIGSKLRCTFYSRLVSCG
ncbi:MAG TPA: hypothetical protein VIO38_10140 [Rariglobus sp.]